LDTLIDLTFPGEYPQLERVALMRYAAQITDGRLRMTMAEKPGQQSADEIDTYFRRGKGSSAA